MKTERELLEEADIPYNNKTRQLFEKWGIKKYGYGSMRSNNHLLEFIEEHRERYAKIKYDKEFPSKLDKIIDSD